MRKTILVVEDDLDLRETMLQVLEGAGYDVVLAANGKEALDALLTRRKISLILLDLSMQEVDGLEFRRRQLANPNLSKVPLVLLSGSSEDQSDEEALDFVGSLKKPFGEDDLLRLVSRYCGNDPEP